MELALFMYFTGVVNSVKGFFGAVALLTPVAFFLYAAYPDIKPKYKYAKIAVFSMLFFGIASAIIPSEKTMYMMAGGYVAQSVVQSDTGDKVVKLVNSKLDEMLVDIQKKVESK